MKSTRTIRPSAAYAAVARAVERIRNDEHATVATMSPGDVVRQGDLYLLMLDREVPGGAPAGRQLAPGSTQGSRHVAEGDADVLSVPEEGAAAAVHRLVPATRGQRLFVGPMIRARGPITVTHPEHGDRTLPGKACYLVVFQRAWGEEVRRQAD